MTFFDPICGGLSWIFYDILIYSQNWDEHQKHLCIDLQLLKDNHFKANQKKCSFGCLWVEYLGHIILAEGVAMDPAKVSVVVN